MDDEPLARLNLSSLLAAEPDFEIVGECGDAISAVRAIGELHPRLAFLDVQMPGLNGFSVLEATPAAALPAIVFVTAHEQFAVQAFEAQALDYLLKPFRRERFRQSLERARLHVAGDQAATAPMPAAADAERMVVKSGGRWIFIAFDELDVIRAAANYVTLHVGADRHDVREKIGDLEARLPAGRFVRIHRSYIVRVAALRSLYPLGGGEHMAVLRNGRELPVGASCLETIHAALAHLPQLGGRVGQRT